MKRANACPGRVRISVSRLIETRTAALSEAADNKSFSQVAFNNPELL